MKTKSDSSIHNVCIAAIKRKTRKPHHFEWTAYYENSDDFSNKYRAIEIDFEDGELVICSTMLDENNWTVLTTRRIFTKEKGELKNGTMRDAISHSPGNFKGYGNQKMVLGKIKFSDGFEMNYFIETSEASMVMIYGILTRIGM